MSEHNNSPQNTSRAELRQLVCNQLQTLLEAQNLEGAKALLSPVQPVDIAEAIEGLPESMQAIAFRLLPKSEAIVVYEYLDSAVQQSLIQEFKRQEVIDIVDKMSPDDRAKLFDELPAKVVRRLLEQLSPKERQATALLLGYGEDTAGRIMTPEYISLKETLTISEAIERIRNLANASEVIYYVYVTGEQRRLSGIVSLRSLVIASVDRTLSEIMTRDLVWVDTNTDQEEVAKLISRYDLLAIPVVDREQRLVGVVTVDDVIDILEKEATEDIYALGAVSSDGDNYFQSSLFTVARRRVIWLFVLLITNTVTGGIISSQQELLEKVVSLTIFIPLLTGTGGNVGSQTSTVVIRGLNTDEIKDLSPGQVIFREALAGALLGTILGVVATVWAFWLLEWDLYVATCVGMSLLAISTLAATAGSALPYFFRLLGLDPAFMSSPFISTSVDVLGVLIYFNLAKIILQDRL
ncbi:MAG: magnesium transporter [Prochloraceae cyanobacterium]|nr:magnesium transporter [Prochloraceae cyanobacterium]